MFFISQWTIGTLADQVLATNSITPEARSRRASRLSRKPALSTLIPVASALLGLLTTAPAIAENLCDPCVVRLAPNTTAAPIPMSPGDGWFLPTDTTSVTVEREPTHGTWDAHAPVSTFYTPDDSFWAAGMDQIVFRIQTTTGLNEGLRTLLILAEDPVITHQRNLSFTGISDLSELTGWSAQGTAHLHIETTMRAPEEHTLRVAGTASPIIEPLVKDDTGEGLPAPNALLGGETVVSPEDGGNINVHRYQGHTILDVDGMISIQDRFVIQADGTVAYDARAVFDSNDFPCNPCETPWLRVDSNVELASQDPDYYTLKVEASQRVIGHASMTKWSMRLWVNEDVSDGQGNITTVTLAEDEIWSDPPHDFPTVYSTRVGAMDLVLDPAESGPAEAAIGIRSAYRYAGKFNNPAEMTFADFDERNGTNPAVADDTAFVETGLVHASNWAGDRNNYRYIALDDLDAQEYPSTFSPVSTGIGASLMVDHSPYNAKEVRAQLSLAATGTLPAGTNINILSFRQITGSGGDGILAVVLKADSSGQLRLRLDCKEEDQTWHSTPWVLAGSHIMDLSVSLSIDDSSSGEPANGEARLVLGDQVVTISGLGHGAYTVDAVNIGGWILRYKLDEPNTTSPKLNFDSILISYNN